MKEKYQCNKHNYTTNTRNTEDRPQKEIL